MPIRFAASAALVIAFLLSPPAWGVDLYVNGVKVTGLKNQLFEHCRVRLDEQGHVHVTAKGYRVERLEQESTAGQPPTAAKRPRKRYFIVTAGRDAARVHYDVEVYVNGARVKVISSANPPLVEEITQHLYVGANPVQLLARKRRPAKGGDGAARDRGPPSADSYLRVLLGSGTTAKGTVHLTETLIDFRLTADRYDTQTRHLKVQAQ